MSRTSGPQPTWNSLPRVDRLSASCVEDRVEETRKARVDFRAPKPVNDLGPVLARFDEPGAAKNGEMIGDGRARQSVGRCAVARQPFALGRTILVEHSYDLESRWIRQRMKQAGQRNIVQVWVSEARHHTDIEQQI